jgi:hypothetical protein
MGEHSREVATALGYDEPAVDRLFGDGVLTGPVARGAPGP